MTRPVTLIVTVPDVPDQLTDGGWLASHLTDDDLADIEARWAKATPGEWRVTTGRYIDLHFGDCGPGAGVDMGTGGDLRGFFAAGFRPDDAEAIAHAPTDIARLLAAVRTERARAVEHAERLAAVADERDVWERRATHLLEDCWGDDDWSLVDQAIGTERSEK